MGIDHSPLETIWFYLAGCKSQQFYPTLACVHQKAGIRMFLLAFFVDACGILVPLIRDPVEAHGGEITES